jgi:hypothetical protein
MTTQDLRIVHIEWEGPLSWKQALQLNSSKDYGTYQIYGCHPVYGSDVLLYIGKAERQTFGNRISQETWWEHQADFGRLSLYVGRFAGYSIPTDEEWGRQIHLAERLLIAAHLPACNAQKNIQRDDPEMIHLHLFNWGTYRSLIPEVSGFRWASHFEGDGYDIFDTNFTAKQAPIQIDENNK